ncbi:MAG: hypothetical protein V2I67_17560 [Thermoanaerobaculales bacterium]|nr:hypothetical protein [Thermoanaerobaculales bacterium]
MNRILVSLRLGAVFVSMAINAYCAVTISDVTGPSRVVRGSVAEYVIDIEITENQAASDSHFSWLLVDVPEGWTFHSSDYEGAIGGYPISGIGTLIDPPHYSYCDDWPTTPGTERIWIESEIFQSHVGDGQVTARAGFNVGESVGEHLIAFRLEAEQGPDTACSEVWYADVRVTDPLPAPRRASGRRIPR